MEEPFVESDLKWNSVEDIKYLASFITQSLNNDPTLGNIALYISEEILIRKNWSLDEAIQRFSHEKGKKLLMKFIKTSSFQTFGADFRPFGVALVSFSLHSKIQQALDVKQAAVEKEKSKGIITPDIKSDILYNNDKKVWIRFFRKEKPTELMVRQLFDREVQLVELTSQVYELYFAKIKNVKDNKAKIFNMIDILDNEWGSTLIFVSELGVFQSESEKTVNSSNIQLFVSNFVRFHWCYLHNRDTHDPQTPDERQAFMKLIPIALSFANSKNLSCMPPDTHHTLQILSGERPATVLNKHREKLKDLQEVSGSRSMKTFNLAADSGSASSKIELAFDFDISPNCLDTFI